MTQKPCSICGAPMHTLGNEDYVCSMLWRYGLWLLTTDRKDKTANHDRMFKEGPPWPTRPPIKASR